MELNILLILVSLLCLLLARSNASLPAEIYWHSKLPNTPIPQELQELLQPDMREQFPLWDMGFKSLQSFTPNAGYVYNQPFKSSEGYVYSQSFKSPKDYYVYGQPSKLPETGYVYSQPFKPSKDYYVYGQPSKSSESYVHNQPSKLPETGYVYSQSFKSPKDYYVYGQPAKSSESYVHNQPAKLPETGYVYSQSFKSPKDYYVYGQPAKSSESYVHNQPSKLPETGYVYSQSFKRPSDGQTDGENIHGKHLSNSNVFLYNDLHEGKKMRLHITKSTNKARILARQVADSIPFSTDKFPSILEHLSIKPESPQSKIIKKTLTDCEFPGIKGEEKSCVTSLESLIDFTVAHIGDNVQVLYNEIEKPTMEQEYTILGVKTMGKNPVVCHKQNYPYAVYYCHEIKATNVYMAPLMGADGTKAKAIVVCHSDTLNWNPKNVMFVLLNVKPGEGTVCHIIGSDTLVWLSTEAV
ncbi:BURP domain-containing protein 5 isoform X2 [Ricinus communis]|uniref:BURP domain-containing protein 5 isoform X2 n=1 Tax=Ricinus communis TaxID=3988 RepID=UPI00201AF91E|nr:BURP domain-containing protein 5 isoform X2 [Ricinus communis]